MKKLLPSQLAKLSEDLDQVLRLNRDLLSVETGYRTQLERVANQAMQQYAEIMGIPIPDPQAPRPSAASRSR